MTWGAPEPTNYSWQTVLATIGVMLLVVTLVQCMASVPDNRPSGGEAVPTCGRVVAGRDYPADDDYCARAYDRRLRLVLITGAAAGFLIIGPAVWQKRRARRQV